VDYLQNAMVANGAREIQPDRLMQLRRYEFSAQQNSLGIWLIFGEVMMNQWRMEK